MRFAILLAFAVFVTVHAGGTGKTDDVKPVVPERYQPLTKATKTRLAVVWGVHEQHVYQASRVAYSRDSKTALIASSDPVEKNGDDHISVFDLSKGIELRRITVKKARVSAVAISPDGKSALGAIVSDDRTATVRLWELATGNVIHEFNGTANGLLALKLSSDGGLGLAGGAQGLVLLWDVRAGKLLHAFAGHRNGTLSVDFSPNGEQALTGGQDGLVRLWNLKTGEEIKRIDLKWVKKAAVHALAFLPDGNRFVAADKLHAALWDIKDNKELRRFEKGPLSDIVDTLTLSADGKHLFVLRSSYNQLRNRIDHFVTCWDVDSGHEIWESQVELKPATPLSLTPDGRTLLLGGGESHFIELDAQTGKEKRVYGGHCGPILQVAFEPKSDRFWTASTDKTVKCWSLKSNLEAFSFKPHDDAPTCMAVAGDTLLTASTDKSLKQWLIGTGKLMREMTGHTAGINSLAVAKGGKIAITGSGDRSLKLWDLGTGKEVKTLTGHSHSVTAVGLSPDGKWGVSGSEDTTVRVWYLPSDGKDVEPVVLDGHKKEVTAVAFLPDGKHVLSASQDQTLILWNIEDARAVRTFKGHKNWIASVALSSDGKRAVTTSDDLTVKLWNVETGQEIDSVDLGSASDVAKCAAWLPDERGFLTGTASWLVLKFELGK